MLSANGTSESCKALDHSVPETWRSPHSLVLKFKLEWELV